MAADFALEVQKLAPGRQAIAVEGEIDLFTAPELKQQIIEVIDGGCAQIVIDLSRTTFVDSTALGVLIGAAKRVRAIDGELVIVNSDETIAKTFEITGLDQIFAIRPTRDEAVAALEASGAQA